MPRHLVILLIVLAAQAAWAQRGARRPAPVERFFRMAPQQRKQALDNLPPERQQQMERRLQRYNSLSPAEREDLNRRYQAFQELPPERQAKAREYFRQFAGLPEQRRVKLRAAWDELRGLEPAAREQKLASPAFRKQFNGRERDILAGVANLFGEQIP